MKISLSKKIYFIIFSFFILFSFLTTFTVFTLAKSEIESLEKEYLKDIALEQMQEVKVVFDESMDELKHLLYHREDMAEFLSNPQDNSLKEVILEEFHHHNVSGKYASIYLMDKNGLAIASTDQSFENNNYSFRYYFQQAVAGNYVLDLARGVTSHQLGYYIAGPVKDDSGQVMGVVVFKLNPEIIHRSFVGDSEEFNNMLVDKYGVIIFSNDEDKLYKSLHNLSDKEQEEVNNSRRYDDLKIEPIDYKDAQKFIRGNSKVAVFDFFDSFDNEREVMAVVKLDSYEFFILMEAEYDIISGAAIRIAQRISVLILLFSIFISLFILFFISQLLKPLKILEKGIIEITKGDLSHRTKIKTGDELEQIGRGFNSMADRLQKNIENIEKEVHERTSSLEKLNKHMIGRELRMVELKNELKKYQKDKKGDNKSSQ